MGNSDPWDDGIPVERINGETVLMLPRPLLNHAEVKGAITCAFYRALHEKPCEVIGGVVVELDDQNHFVPDMMVICDSAQIREGCIVGAPALVVEVLSPSTELRDRGVKMCAYEKAGLQEYWLVDVVSRKIEIYRQIENHLTIARIYRYFSPKEQAENAALHERHRLSDEDMEQTITVDLCGGFTVSLGDIFENVLP